MTTLKNKTPITYQDAGVNINASKALVKRIAKISDDTRRPEVMSAIGGFNSLCRIPTNYRQPVLVSSTDGVGTKLQLAIALEEYHNIGIDLVAMCVNDVLTSGAEPLFFLDYYATSKLDVEVATEIIKGINTGCKLSGAALVGGETAELPNSNNADNYSLAGFCVGIVEENKILNHVAIKTGDTLIALPSSGPHANGYSLIRKILHKTQADLTKHIAGKPLANWLLEPTRIYVQALRTLLTNTDVHAMAHITGGGLVENIPRILPQDKKAIIDLNSWQLPAIFDWLQTEGNIDKMEMLRTFNCGIGMLVSIPNQEANKALHILQEAGETAWLAGTVAPRTKDEQQVQFQS